MLRFLYGGLYLVYVPYRRSIEDPRQPDSYISEKLLVFAARCHPRHVKKNRGPTGTIIYCNLLMAAIAE